MLGSNRRREPFDVGRPRRGRGRRPDALIVRRLEPRPWLDPRTLDRDDARQADPWIAEAIGQRDAGREFARQCADGWAAGRDHELRPGIEATAGVIEGVDRGFGMEVAVATPVDPLEQVGEERGHVVGIEARGIATAYDEEILGERQLPLAEDRRGLCEQFGGPARPFPGHVALAAHGQQQRVDSRGVDRMHARHAGKNGGDHGAGEFVHEPAEERVFLRGAADDRHRPDRPVTMPDMLDPHHGKVVPPRVVAQMVAERSLRLGGSGRDRALDHEVGVGIDRWTVAAGDHRQPMTGQHACECQLGEALRQRHHG